MQEANVIELIKKCNEGNVKKDDISRLIGYMLSKKDLRDIAKLYNESNKKIKEIIEYVLTDCNFHTECSLLTSGKWKKVGQDLRIER